MKNNQEGRFFDVTTKRFDAFCERKEQQALAARLPGFRTVANGASAMPGLRAIGNAWSRQMFDGDFYRTESAGLGLPVVSLVFVQSRDGNTVADNPSVLGGGETDKHLIYEGLSRIKADAVLAGATTARGKEMVFSIWHPELVRLRRDLGLPRHPAQVVVTDRGDLRIEDALMYQEPALRVFIVTRSPLALALRDRLRERPWVDVIDAGEPLSLARALHDLYDRGINVISAVGGRSTATALLREHLVSDIYLTTSPIEAGQPHTPFYEGPPLRTTAVLVKAGKENEEGVTFEHLIVET